MYQRKRELTEKLTPSNTVVNLPRTSLIDSIVIYPKVTLSNSDTANSQTATLEEILNAITEVRVMSDGGMPHYAIGMLPAYILGYYKSRGKLTDLSTSYTVDAGGTLEVTLPPIKLDEGDIFAPAHSNITMTATVNTTVNANISISDYTFRVAINELVGTEADYKALYGSDFEKLAEVKVSQIFASLSQNTTPTKALEIPTGTLVRQGYILVKDSTGARSDSVVSRVVVSLETRGVQLLDMGWDIFQTEDRFQHNIEPLTGVSIIDFDQDIFQNGLGLPAFDLARGDVVLKTQNDATGTLVYVSVESVVYNPDKVFEAVIEAE